MTLPLVSVLLPVYNGKKYLRAAIDSILDQTYRNFELLIINDGSKDGSAEIANAYTDARVRVYHQENRGLSATLNRAIGLARGQYLARQDQDDVSYPTRFEKQVAFLERHPDHGMVGAWAEIWVGSDRTERVHKHPCMSPVLKFELLFNNPFVHSSMMIRKDVFERVGQYSTDPLRQPPEDYELWSRVSREYEVANIPEILHVYREVPKSMSRSGVNPFLSRLMMISSENISWYYGKEQNDDVVRDLAALANGQYEKLSGRCNMIQMLRALSRITERIADMSHEDCRELHQRSDRFSRMIARRYLRYRYIRSRGFLGKLKIVLSGNAK